MNVVQVFDEQEPVKSQVEWMWYVCVLPPLVMKPMVPGPFNLSLVWCHHDQLHTHPAACFCQTFSILFFSPFLRGLLFLLLFLAVDQQTQLIECDLAGFSSPALSHPLAYPPACLSLL